MWIKLFISMYIRKEMGYIHWARKTVVFSDIASGKMIDNNIIRYSVKSKAFELPYKSSPS